MTEIEILKADNARLRGTLGYILAQSQQDYPGVLSVIRANAKAALDDDWQKTVKSTMDTLASADFTKLREVK